MITLKTENLTKAYGPFLAVDHIQFEAKTGEVLAFLGPNGAGKSTTMKLMAGYLRPTQGRVLLDGVDIVKNLVGAKEKIGYMPESTPAYKEMTVYEYLFFAAEAYDLESPREAVDRVLDSTAIDEVSNKLVETLSKGYRSRLSFAAAMIHDPPVLLLDEPTDGLDPNQKSEIRTLIRKLRHDKVIIVSTHILEEVEAMCNRVVVISEGKIVLDGTPKDLQGQVTQGGEILITIPHQQREKVEKLIHSPLRAVENGAGEGFTSYIVQKQNLSLEEVAKNLVDSRVPFQGVTHYHPPLDSAFRKLTRTTE